MIKLIFFGSPQNAADLLAKLDKDTRFKVVAAVTQPDRPIGRKKKLSSTPVAQYAKKNNIITLKPPCHPQKKHLIKNSRKLKQQIQDLLSSESTLLRGTENLADYLSTKKKIHPNFPLVSAKKNSRNRTNSLANVLEKGYRGALLDLILSYEFGQLILKEILAIPSHGGLNIHFSLLPSYRGAAPLAWQIVNGEKETGISVVKMSSKFDTGDIIYQETHSILPIDTTQSLHSRLALRVLEILPNIIADYLNGKLTHKLSKRPKLKASYYPRLTRQDGYIPWNNFLFAVQSDASHKMGSVALERRKKIATEIERKIRAFYPWPGVWTRIKSVALKNLKNKRLKILSAKLENGKLTPLKVQLAGKKPQDWKELKKLI